MGLQNNLEDQQQKYLKEGQLFWSFVQGRTLNKLSGSIVHDILFPSRRKKDFHCILINNILLLVLISKKGTASMEFQSRIECPTGIYKLTNIKTNIVYIGQTSIDFIGRWKAHVSTLEKQTHRNPYLQRTWNKYGAGAFMATVEAYIPVTPDADLFYAELDRQEFLILKKYPNHYNLMEAGEDRMIFSEESRARASYSAKHRKITREEKEIWEHNRLAATRSIEAREKRSKAHKELWADPKQREKFITAYNQPETVKKKSNSIKASWTPERRIKQVQINISMHSDPEFKKRHRSSIKDAHTEPGGFEKYSVAMVKGWITRKANPNYAESEKKRIEKIKATKAKKKQPDPT